MPASALTLNDLPAEAASTCSRLGDELLAILEGDLLGLWLYGGTTFPDRPLVRGDLDLGGIVGSVGPNERRWRDWGEDAASRPWRVAKAVERVAHEDSFGIDLVLIRAEDAGGGELATHAFMQRRTITDWAVVRGHWLAGQYVLLHGKPPEDFVMAPTHEELLYALDREIEHLEAHVAAGDASNPYEATYAMWNGCRILRTLATGSPVISKRSAGDWGLANLDERWHDAIRAAGRSYDGNASAADNELLRVTMPSFVEHVRSYLAPTEERDGGPRWSG